MLEIVKASLGEGRNYRDNGIVEVTTWQDLYLINKFFLNKKSIHSHIRKKFMLLINDNNIGKRITSIILLSIKH